MIIAITIAIIVTLPAPSFSSLSHDSYLVCVEVDVDMEGDLRIRDADLGGSLDLEYRRKLLWGWQLTMTLWEKESKTPSLRPRGVPSLSANHHYHHNHSPLPLVARRSSGRHKWTPFANTSSQSSRCPEMSMWCGNDHFKGFQKQQKKGNSKQIISHRCVHQLDWLEVIKRSSSVEVRESTLC